jgi:hypothetical protein
MALLKHYQVGSCLREFYALQMRGVPTEQGIKLPEEAGHMHIRLSAIQNKDNRA